MGLRREALIRMALGWPGECGAVAIAPAKKRIGIEALLRWAYLDELPKRPRASAPGPVDAAWRKVGEWLEELSLAGLDQNAYGVVCDFSASSWPHPDAQIVHEAVGALDGLELGLPDDWNPIADLPDLGALGAAAVGRAVSALCVKGADGGLRTRQSPRRLVFRHAILGGEPDWGCETPEKQFVRGANGKTRWFRRVLIAQDAAFGQVMIEREVEGFNAKAKREYDDAYPKEVLEPDPVDSIVSRGEYEIWRSALAFLVEELAGALDDFDAVMTDRPGRPWETGAARKGLIWPDLSPKEAVLPTYRIRARRARPQRRLTAI